MKKYKSYFQQVRECKENGTQKCIKNVYSKFPSHFLVCTKYWQCCSSRVCREDRGLDPVKPLNLEWAKRTIDWFGDEERKS